MKTRLFVLAASVLSAAVISGCGDDPSPKIRSFAASDTSIPEGGTDVTFTWDVKNASSLELLPFPGAVSGSSATVTVTEETTFTLVAKNKTRSARKTLEIAVGEAFDVVGHVVDNQGGVVRPTPGATVAIDGRFTVTDENGTFTFQDVVAPYDLIVLYAGANFGGQSYVQVFLGVTRPDPTVDGEGYPTGLPDRTGNIAGTISGGAGFPNPLGETYAYTRIEGQAGASLDAIGAAAYNLPYNWQSSETSADVVTHFLQFDYATVEYDHARVEGTLTDGGTLTLDPTLVDVPEGTYIADFEATWSSNRYTYASFGFYELGMSSGLFFGIPAVESTTGLITFTYPQAPNLDAYLTLGAEDSAGWSETGYGNPPATITAVVPEPPRVLSPANGGTVGPNTPFSVIVPGNRINKLNFYQSLPFGGPSYPAYVDVFTDKTSVSFPDLSAIGLPLPPGTSLNWDVYSYGPFTSIDDALGQPTGHWTPPGDVIFESGLTNDRYFVTEGGP